MLHPPSPPPFRPPRTMAEAGRRYAAARGALARIRMRLRAGELLAQWPANAAAEDLRIGWIRASQDELIAAHGADLIAAAGIHPDHAVIFGLWMLARHQFALALRLIWPGREILDIGTDAMTELRATLAGRAEVQRRRRGAVENGTESKVEGMAAV
jgi:hypothetical protein